MPPASDCCVDWRSPAAEPFFGATHANPMGLVSRRRYRWSRGRISDYWDEVFTAEGLERRAALDDDDAFIASLGADRTSRMRDVLSTIQADQDAIIRAGSHGALVVDGGPGTGKTVVALHRTAYLLYSDPRIGRGGGGVLFVGPHQAYLAYVDDILPSLGEDSVQICTLRDLIAEGAEADAETDPDAARLKSSATLVSAIETAVRLYERPPTGDLMVETPWTDVWLTAADWAEAFDSAEPGAAHNEARDQVWETLLEILVDRRPAGMPTAMFRRELAQNEELVRTFSRAWPILDPNALVAQLWTSPAFLQRCAPGLSADEVAVLQRSDGRAWTVSDLPFLDAALRRIGDPEASRRRRQREATLAAEREEMTRVVDHLIAADDSEMSVMSMLRGQDFQNTLDDDSALPGADPDLLAGPFAHIVVDEAQELTDAEWQMLLARCPSRSFTIVGDRAQARHGFTESWQERLAPDRPDAGGDRRAEHQLPHPGGGHGRSRTGHPRRPAGCECADVDPQQRHPGAAWVARRARCDRRGLERRARRGRRVRHRASRLHPDVARAVADPGVVEGARVRPGGARRAGRVRDRHRGRGRSLCRDDPGDPAARHPDGRVTGAGRPGDCPPAGPPVPELPRSCRRSLSLSKGRQDGAHGSRRTPPDRDAVPAVRDVGGGAPHRHVFVGIGCRAHRPVRARLRVQLLWTTG